MEIVKFKVHKDDLVDNGRLCHWSSKSCDKAENEIIEFFLTTVGSMPCKNMALIKMMSINIDERVTIPELRNLAERIYKYFRIKCFQISIDRNSSSANMLFDFVDRSTAKSVYMNVSDRKLLTCLIAKELNMKEHFLNPVFLRYSILLEYKDDPMMFSKYKGFLANYVIGTKAYSNLVDILNYMEHICNGRTVLRPKH